jgi:molybdopterin synthase sulfur carrier subunit
VKLTVLYFAALREALKLEREQVLVPPQVRDVSDLRRWLCARGGVWAEQLGPDRVLRVAVNRGLAGADSVLTEGAEVAYFPPVTGG